MENSNKNKEKFILKNLTLLIHKIKLFLGQKLKKKYIYIKFILDKSNHI